MSQDLQEQAPFQSLAFTLLEDKRPRASFQLTAAEGGMYDLHVQKGSAANPLMQFSRKVPLEAASRLRDSLQAIGVFGWEESYGDAAAPGTRRWSLKVVFKEGVFSLESRGGSDVPPGFDDLLEELYRMDFPRPSGARLAGAHDVGLAGPASRAPMAAGDLAAFASKFDLPGLDAGEMQRLLAQAGSNPEALAQRMKDEFRHLPPADQDQMLDALAATGLATRDWWERFFRS